jgi:ABC-2 type transport system permease protein
MNAFFYHFAFEFRTGIRNKVLLMMNYLFPLGFYLMMGFVMVPINPSFLESIIPAMIIFSILASTLLGIPDQLVTGREEGIFRSYKINGVPVTSIVTIPALTTVVHMVIVTLIITVSAPLLFDAPLPVNWLNYVIIVIAMAIASAGISVLIGVISPSTRLTVLFSQLIFLPSMLLGGLMVPNSLLPETIGVISQMLPATQAMNAFNGLAMGGVAEYNPWGSIIVLAATGVLAFVLGVFLFSWDSRNSTRRASPMFALLVLVPPALGILLT